MSEAQRLINSLDSAIKQAEKILEKSNKRKAQYNKLNWIQKLFY